MAATLANVLSGQIEKVRGKLQELIETAQTAAALVKKGTEVITVSNRAARIPVLIANGGDYGVVNLDGGPLGLGSGLQLKHMEIQYFPTKVGVEVTTESMWTTDSEEKAVINAFKENLRRSMQEAQILDDIAFHNITGNQGVLAVGNGSTAIGGTNPFSAGQSATITLDANFATQLLRPNMPVEIYDSTLATQKTAANSPDVLPRVTAINVAAKTATITGQTGQSGAITLANSDRLVVAGIQQASVVFKNGLYLFNTATTSGSLLNLDKTVVPELNSNVVNAASGGLVPAHIILLKHMIAMRRGEVGELKGLAHPAQLAGIAQLGYSLSQWSRGSNDKMIDVVPDIGTSVKFGGVEFLQDIRQNRSRIDLIATKTWGRVRLRDLDFYKDQGTGATVFEKRSANGGVSTAFLMYIVGAENFFCADPGSNGFIQNLSVPAGY